MKAEMMGGTNDWYRQALAALERAVTLSAKSEAGKGTGKLLWNLGLCHVRLGDLRQALDVFRRWVELEPYKAEAHVAVGSALLGLGESDEAVTALHRALICNQENQEANRLLVEIYRLNSTADGCELLTKEAGAWVNYACEEVKRSRCEACRWFEERTTTREILERCRSFQCLQESGYHLLQW
jgi:tetratricopeptide (TPR) repeat protein